MLPIEVIWNDNQVEVVHLYPMQTYNQFINYVAQIHKSHRDFLTHVSAQNLQQLLDDRTLVVTDVLPRVINQRDMNKPDLTAVSSFDTKSLLYNIFIVTHVEAYNPLFQYLMESDNAVRSVVDVLDHKHATIDALNNMTTIKHMDLVPADVPRLAFMPVDYIREHMELTLSKTTSIHALFDKYALTYSVPHIQTQKFFKTRFDFIPDSKWIDTARTTYKDDVMVIKYNPEKAGLRALNNPYLSYFEAQIQRNKAMIDVPYGSRYVLRDECIQRALGQYDVSDYKQRMLVCTTSFKVDESYEPLIFVDFIMNDKYVSRAFSINESNVAHRQRPLVYVVLNETNQMMSLSLLKDNTLNVKFKVVNHTLLDYMMHCLSIMWFRYLHFREECIAFYATYNVQVKTDRHAQRPPATAECCTLRDLEPDVFIKTYSRHCLHLPRIVDDVEAAEIKRQFGNEYVLEWPAFGETVKRNYACTHHPKNQFPGVHKNNLIENKETFPYVPCCFKVNQYTKKAGGLTDYTKGAKCQPVDKAVLKTDKLVPSTLKRLLGDTVVFKDVEPSYLSFFECLGISSQRVMEIITTSDHPAMLACYQELYTLGPTFDETRLDHFVATQCQGVLMGEYFYRIAEYILGLQVYMFNKCGFIIPPHRWVHIKFQPRAGEGAVCVYNYGNNQYTYIDNVAYTALEIHHMFMDACNQFEDGQAMKPVPFITNVVAQQIDRYGKCRRVKLSDGRIQHIKPSPPYAVPMLVVGDEYVTNTHPIVVLDYNEREFRTLYNQLKHMYLRSNSTDVLSFANNYMKYDPSRTVIAEGIFYSPIVEKFKEKLSLEEWNNTLSVTNDVEYTTPVDFQWNDYSSVWSTDHYPTHFGADLTVKTTLDPDNTHDTYLFLASSKQVCVAQPCGTSLSTAAYVCDVWRHMGYNPYSRINSTFDPGNVETNTYDYKWVNHTLISNNRAVIVDRVIETGTVLVNDTYYVALLKLRPPSS